MKHSPTNHSVHESDLSSDQPDQNISVGSGKTTASFREARPAQEPNQKIQGSEKIASSHEAASVPRLKIKHGRNCAVLDAKSTELLRRAIAADDKDFLEGTLNQLAEACSRNGVINERKWNFMLSEVKGIKPTNQIEAMLAAEMAVVHDTMMSLVRRLRFAGSIEEVDSFGNIASKFARTFTMQMEVLHRCRSGGEQKVTVQNVSVSDGGQAIVGTVTQNAPGSDRTSEAASQAAITDARTTPMPIIEQGEKPIMSSTKRRQRN
jgi:hypothetical protein